MLNTIPKNHKMWKRTMGLKTNNLGCMFTDQEQRPSKSNTAVRETRNTCFFYKALKSVYMQLVFMMSQETSERKL